MARSRKTARSTYTMPFNVYERLMLAAVVLPQEGGSFREAMRVRKLRKQLMLSEEEQKSIDFTVNDKGNPTWNARKAIELGNKEIELLEGDREIIALGFKALEEKKSVPTDDAFLDLYSRFEADVEALNV